MKGKKKKELFKPTHSNNTLSLTAFAQETKAPKPLQAEFKDLSLNKHSACKTWKNAFG